MEHPLDRFVRRFRAVFIVGAALCLPIFLVSYGKMIVMAFEAWPAWAFWPSIFAQALIFVGASCLRDSQIERQLSQAPEQSVGPDPR